MNESKKIDHECKTGKRSEIPCQLVPDFLQSQQNVNKIFQKQKTESEFFQINQNDNFNTEKSLLPKIRNHQKKTSTDPKVVLIEIAQNFKHILQECFWQDSTSALHAKASFNLEIDKTRMTIRTDCITKKTKIIFSIQNNSIRNYIPIHRNSDVCEEVYSQFSENKNLLKNSRENSNSGDLSKDYKMHSTDDQSRNSAFQKSEQFINILIEQIKSGKFVFLNHFLEKIDKIASLYFYASKISPGANYFLKMTQMIEQKASEYRTIMAEYFEEFEYLSSRFKVKFSKYPSIPLQPRLFNEISEYKSILSDHSNPEMREKYSVQKSLKSSLKASCGNCFCKEEENNLADFACFNPGKAVMESNCRDRRENVECDDNCACGIKCPNRQLQANNFKSLGKEIRSQVSWGIDLFTSSGICDFIPTKIDENDQFQQKDKTLKEDIIKEIVNEMNSHQNEGWNLTVSFKNLYERYQKKFRECKSLLNADNCDYVESIGLYDYRFPDNSKSFCSKISLLEGEIQSEESKNFNRLNFVLSEDIHCQTKNSSEFGHSDIPNFDNRQPKNNFSIHESACEDFDNSEYQNLHLKKVIYKTLLHYSKISQARFLFRGHTKGMGVFNNSNKTIDKNTLVTVYFGEIYPPWYWYVKQDVIKSFLMKAKRSSLKEFSKYKNNYSMDFYNIMLEKSIKEKDGKELAFIDPIFNGNFASRLSHSCKPNCITFPISSKGSYYIGLYAIQNIQADEELTFDYCSFTESQKEYEDSVCLCGSQLCNGHYLNYYKKHSKAFIEAMKIKNGEQFLIDKSDSYFMDFNYAILHLSSPFLRFDQSLLNKFGFGQNLFKESPIWIKKWSSIIIEMIEKEKADLYKNIMETESNVAYENLTDDKKEIRQDIEDLHYQRLHNLVVSVDKLQHFLSDCKKKDGSMSKTFQQRPIFVPESFVLIEFNRLIVKNLAEETLKNTSIEKLETIKGFLDIFMNEKIMKTPVNIVMRLHNEAPSTIVNPVSSRRVNGRRSRSLKNYFRQRTREKSLLQKSMQSRQENHQIGVVNNYTRDVQQMMIKRRILEELDNFKSLIFNNADQTQNNTKKQSIDPDLLQKLPSVKMIDRLKVVINLVFGENQYECGFFKALYSKIDGGLLNFDKTRLIVLKFLILKFSCLFSERQSDFFRIIGNIVYFHAMTVNQFQYNIYDPMTVSVKIRECDLTNPSKLFQKTNLSRDDQIKNLQKSIAVESKSFKKNILELVCLVATRILA